jgi:hypothetical protein
MEDGRICITPLALQRVEELHLVVVLLLMLWLGLKLLLTVAIVAGLAAPRARLVKDRAVEPAQ